MCVYADTTHTCIMQKKKFHLTQLNCINCSNTPCLTKLENSVYAFNIITTMLCVSVYGFIHSYHTTIRIPTRLVYHMDRDNHHQKLLTSDANYNLLKRLRLIPFAHGVCCAFVIMTEQVKRMIEI